MDAIDEVVELFESFDENYEVPELVSRRIAEIYNRSDVKAMLLDFLRQYQSETYQDKSLFVRKREQINKLVKWFKNRIKTDWDVGEELGEYKDFAVQYAEQFEECYAYFYEFADRYKSEPYYDQLMSMGANVYLMFFIYFGELFATIAYEQFLNLHGTTRQDILKPERKYLRHFIILSYAIVDFVLDDPSISDEDKRTHIKRIGGRLMRGTPSGIGAFDDSYAAIETHFPRAEYPMIYEGIWYAFSKECQTLKDDSLRATFLKGTTLTAFVSGTLLPRLRFEDYPRDIIRSQQLIGFLAQISDDTIDIAKDMEEYNHTYATKWYLEHGNAEGIMNRTMQTYLTYTMVHSLTMKNVYGFRPEQELVGKGFVMLTMIFNLYVIQAFPEYFSEEYSRRMDYLCIGDDAEFVGLIRHYLLQI